MAFTVSGSTADFTPPVLVSVTQTGSPIRPGETATMSYAVESQDPLTYVSVRYADRLGKSAWFRPTEPTLTGAGQKIGSGWTTYR